MKKTLNAIFILLILCFLSTTVFADEPLKTIDIAGDAATIIQPTSTTKFQIDPGLTKYDLKTVHISIKTITPKNANLKPNSATLTLDKQFNFNLITTNNGMPSRTIGTLKIKLVKFNITPPENEIISYSFAPAAETKTGGTISGIPVSNVSKILGESGKKPETAKTESKTTSTKPKPKVSKTSKPSKQPIARTVATASKAVAEKTVAVKQAVTQQKFSTSAVGEFLNLSVVPSKVLEKDLATKPIQAIVQVHAVEKFSGKSFFVWLADGSSAFPSNGTPCFDGKKALHNVAPEIGANFLKQTISSDKIFYKFDSLNNLLPQTIPYASTSPTANIFFVCAALDADEEKGTADFDKTAWARLEINPENKKPSIAETETLAVAATPIKDKSNTFTVEVKTPKRGGRTEGTPVDRFYLWIAGEKENCFTEDGLAIKKTVSLNEKGIGTESAIQYDFVSKEKRVEGTADSKWPDSSKSWQDISNSIDESKLIEVGIPETTFLSYCGTKETPVKIGSDEKTELEFSQLHAGEYKLCAVGINPVRAMLAECRADGLIDLWGETTITIIETEKPTAPEKPKEPEIPKTTETPTKQPIPPSEPVEQDVCPQAKTIAELLACIDKFKLVPGVFEKQN